MIHQYLIISLLLLLSDNSLTVMAGFALLIPSQIPGANTSRQRNRNHHKEENENPRTTAHLLVPQSRAVDTDPNQDELLPSSSSRRKKTNARTTTTTNTTNNEKTTLSIPRTGNLPDVHWRAISMSHLRSHPNFQPLPPPSMIQSLSTREHVRYFRQDSWQWDYLHVGRCTTSQCSAALGFLEVRGGGEKKE